jgi:hypothetical protein
MAELTISPDVIRDALKDFVAAYEPSGSAANEVGTVVDTADGIAHVGSENMSATSWTMNREVGAQVFEAAPSGVIAGQFEADWTAAVDQP